MSLTKAHVIWFDGHEGIALDFLENEIQFNVNDVPSCIVPYLKQHVEVLIEVVDGITTIALPEYSFNKWRDEEREMQTAETVILNE